MGKKFQVTETIQIDRPVETVFAYACNYQNDPTWRKGVIEMTQTAQGEPCVGMRTQEVMRSYGRNVTTHAQVTEVIPNRRTAFRSTSGPVQVMGCRVCERDGAGTRFTYELSGELDPIFSLLWPLVGKSYLNQINEDLRRLKRVLEQTKRAAR